jgi:VWFA-related protein
VFVSVNTAATEQKHKKHWSGAEWLAAALVLGCICPGLPAIAGQSSPTQSSPSQTTGQSQSPQNQPAQDIPDAPTVQPAATNSEPPPIPKPEEKKPVERDPWTNQPIKPATPDTATAPSTEPGEPTSAPPPMPPIKTLPPGSSTKQGPSAQDQLYKLRVDTTFVQLPVTVKNRDGRMVDGLTSTDFTVKENGQPQKLKFFSADPFALSVAVVLDLGMSDGAVQKVNQTFSALVSAFAPYDEVALYTYSSTVSEVSDFSGASQKLTALLNQMKTERGRNSGPPVLGGPLANGPMINGVPVGGAPTEPVNTPPKEAHVLNDAVLRAALDLSKRGRERRKIIFVISDGREYGSQASYRDVLKLLLTHEIEVKAVGLETAALPVYRKLEQMHIPDQGRGDILPKYVKATGGGDVYTELSLSAISDSYAQAMSEARNQYTLGYTPAPLKTPSKSPCRDVEVVVHRPDLKIYAKQSYCPMLAQR